MLLRFSVNRPLHFEHNLSINNNFVELKHRKHLITR